MNLGHLSSIMKKVLSLTKETMYKYLSWKQIYKAISERVYYKSQFRSETSETSNISDGKGKTSEFFVTEEQIQKDNFANKPPIPPVDDCCGEGCQNCVWFTYVINLKYYTKNDRQKIQEAIDSIPDEDVKAFVQIELGKTEVQS